MNHTLFYLSDWQRQTPSLAERYALEKRGDLSTLLHREILEPEFFIQLISLFQSETDLPIEQLKSFPIAVILDYLEKTHRYYFGVKLLEIEQSILNLHWRIPENELLPYLVSFFDWVRNNLVFHIQMEEEQLFPYIKELCSGLAPSSNFGILSFIENHKDTIELQISEVKKHIVRAQQSVTEIFPFCLLLKQLDEFEKDLRIHARIEDEVLIPLAVELEQGK